MKLPKSRGQALVLMSLTMLLLVLMVCITLAFSQRVREKMETQSVADLAAYSSAVATARTFNSIALMNRAVNAQVVAIAATNSLISWTSMVRASLLVARTSLDGCAPQEVIDALDEAKAEIQEDWEKRDAVAGVQAYNLANTAAWLGNGMEGVLYKQLQESVDGGPKSFATQFGKLATEGSRYPGELKGATTQVSLDELATATAGFGFALDMAMATRGYEFITRRQVTAPVKVPGGALEAIENLDITTAPFGPGGGGGSTYWGDTPKGDTKGHGGSMGMEKTTDFLIAEDHAAVTVSYPGCPTVTRNAFASVRSTDKNDETDDHTWSIEGQATEKADPDLEKQWRHTLLPCDDPRYCPNVFIAGMAFNIGDQSDDNVWAQPKLFSFVQRDYKVRDASGVRADPWLLRFNFQFSPARTSSFDNRGRVTADGTDISVQSALASGLAYYHRRGRWREPPNLWNPFWRATLASVEVDKAGDNDVGRTVGAPGAQAFSELIKAGYKGAH